MSPRRQQSYSLAEITARFGGELIGDGATRIDSVGNLEGAQPGQITFLAGTRYRGRLAESHASAVILGPSDRDVTRAPRIVSENPYAYFARVAHLLHTRERHEPGINRTAVVETTARVAASAHIGPFAYVGANAIIGEQAEIGSGCSIGERSIIGSGSTLFPNVVVYHDCRIGSRVTLHSGVVIGADGFGIAQDAGRWIKIPQIGGVEVGDDVEIGANTTVDRGTIDDTVIESGVKLDNQIQVGHNVRIGAHTAIAGCVGIAGSTRIGKHCMIGGATGIGGHLEICDNVTITGFTMVTKSISEPGTYSSGMPVMPHRAWLDNAVQLRNLESMAQRIRSLERELTTLKGAQS